MSDVILPVEISSFYLFEIFHFGYLKTKCDIFSLKAAVMLGFGRDGLCGPSGVCDFYLCGRA